MQTHRRSRSPGSLPLTQTASVLLVTVSYFENGIWSEPLDELRVSWQTARTPGWSALYSALIRLTDSGFLEYSPETRRSRVTPAGLNRARKEAQLLARKGIKIKPYRSLRFDNGQINFDGKGSRSESAAAS